MIFEEDSKGWDHWEVVCSVPISLMCSAGGILYSWRGKALMDCCIQYSIPDVR